MSRSILLTMAIIGLALSRVPAQAQPLTGATQYPPAPNAASAAPQPLNSVPRGGVTGATVAPGANIDSTQVGPSVAPVRPVPAVNTLHPLRQPRPVVRHPVRRPVRPAPTTTTTPTQQ